MSSSSSSRFLVSLWLAARVLAGGPSVRPSVCLCMSVCLSSACWWWERRLDPPPLVVTSLRRMSYNPPAACLLLLLPAPLPCLSSQRHRSPSSTTVVLLLSLTIHYRHWRRKQPPACMCVHLSVSLSSGPSSVLPLTRPAGRQPRWMDGMPPLITQSLPPPPLPVPAAC